MFKYSRELVLINLEQRFDGSLYTKKLFPVTFFIDGQESVISQRFNFNKFSLDIFGMLISTTFAMVIVLLAQLE